MFFCVSCIDLTFTTFILLGSFLDKARKELGLKTSLRKMEDRLTAEQVVELTRFQRTESPLIQVTYEDIVPETTVAVLNSLAGQLISQHTKEYESSIGGLDLWIVHTSCCDDCVQPTRVGQIQHNHGRAR